MSEPVVQDRARVSVFVAVTPEDAFDVFTNEIDLWWREGPRFRIAGKKRGKLYFVPFEIQNWIEEGDLK